MNLRLRFGLLSTALLFISQQSLALGITGGDVPLPAKTISGTQQVSWNGTYAELLMADALAMCWTTQADRMSGGGVTDSDSFIRDMSTKMSAASCKNTCSKPSFTSVADVFYCSWLDSRKDAACNVDAATGTARALDTSSLRSPSETTAYVVPSPSLLGLSAAAIPMRERAQDELSYAELNLCIAQQLRQKLDTVQVAFASGNDLASVQEAMRERALTSVMVYSNLLKAFTVGTTAPTALTDPNYWMSLLPRWGLTPFAPGVGSKPWVRLGDDFLAATTLLLEATKASVQDKLREGSSQHTFGDIDFDKSKTNVGVRGPRVEILDKILYGQEPTFAPPRRAITTDLSAPEIMTFLALARHAKAVSFDVNGAPGGFSVLNADATGQKWYVTTENVLRQEMCTRQNQASCPQASNTTKPTDFLLWKQQGITLTHAQALAEALIQGVFGPPSFDTKDQPNTWKLDPSAFYADPRGPFGATQQLGFHLLGAHQPVMQAGTAGESATGTIALDPDFRVLPLRSHDIQSMRPALAMLPTFRFNQLMDTASQFASLRSDTVSGPYRRRFGSVTALALAREALLGARLSHPAPKAIYNQAAPALALIDRAIGARQVLVRQNLKSVPNPTACSTCVLGSADYSPETGYGITIDVWTRKTDPFTSGVAVAGIPHAASAALDRNYNSILNWSAPASGARIASPSYGVLTTSFLAAGDDYVRREINTRWLESAPHGMTVLLRAGGATVRYDHLFTGRPGVQSSTVGVPGAIVTFGGSLNGLVDRAWAFKGSNWSAPKYDAFGLPTDWMPAPDATLAGDSAGVSVEQHFLSRAGTAASEATAAIQQAFDTLQQESVDDSALASAEKKAEQLNALELKALCGEAATCVPSYKKRTPSVPACPDGTPDEKSFCNEVRVRLGDIAGRNGVNLASAVDEALTSGTPTPTFRQFSGGRLQSLLLNQWNAWNAVSSALQTAIGSAKAAASEVTAALAEQELANTEYLAADAEIKTAFVQAVGQTSELNAQQTSYLANKQQYDTTLTTAQATMDAECSDQAFATAKTAGWSWSGDNDLGVTGRADKNGYDYHIDDLSGKSWSVGPTVAQYDRCQDATRNYNLAVATTPAQTDAIDKAVSALQDQVYALHILVTEALPARSAAALARKETAVVRVATARAQREAQVSTLYQSVQAAFGALLTTIPAIDQAFSGADDASARVDIDAAQAEYDVRTRFGVRKRYHSYDLWRARALLENARRLAVAARRSIESRYLVDLSRLQAPEPFVDSPSLWADEIYGSDLKPPVALGLVKAGSTSTGVYTNKLDDYVSNLRLFLDGFTIQRPTAVARADAEVIQLPGPAFRMISNASSASFEYLDPASRGWSFYCEGSATWIAHPNSASFFRETAKFNLSTACNGTPPSKARLGFWLDPWGRLNGNGANVPYNARYNVRMGGLAINLVGSGVRRCERAADPAACYAEPFVRYNLEHDGPIAATTYEQSSRLMDVPSAFIEGGKALATEEWLDPVSNGFNRSDVQNVIRHELMSRPIGGAYAIELELTPDVAVEQIERIQLLIQTDYWVRQR